MKGDRNGKLILGFFMCGIAIICLLAIYSVVTGNTDYPSDGRHRITHGLVR